ncbi:hypothetical protein SDC9_94289 [bioreactor metagenome]|uniref:Uncharacterized protein n=1 Tax=bioreactor metagenome TaxID=1076179 RepID=A0A645A4F1_9ZZZZ
MLEKIILSFVNNVNTEKGRKLDDDLIGFFAEGKKFGCTIHKASKKGFAKRRPYDIIKFTVETSGGI